jgi:hypothetical protein
MSLKEEKYIKEELKNMYISIKEEESFRMRSHSCNIPSLEIEYCLEFVPKLK